MKEKGDSAHHCIEGEDELFIKEYKKLAEAVEQDAMEGMENFPEDPEDEKRRFQAIMEKVGKEAGESDTEENPKTVALEKKMPGRRLWASMGKWAAILLVTSAGIIALAMTSEANRSYIIDTVTTLMGKNIQTKINTNEENMVYDESERAARADIEEKINVKIPMLQYKPQGTSFVGYEVYPENMCAIMHYEIQGNRVILHISDGDIEKAATGVFAGQPSQELTLPYEKTKVYIYEEPNGKGEFSTWGAQWEHGNAFYQLSGNIEQEEFFNLIKKITF